MDIEIISNDELIDVCQWVFKKEKNEDELLEVIAQINIRVALLAEFRSGPEYRIKAALRAWERNLVQRIKVLRKNKTIASLKADRSRRRQRQFDTEVANKMVNVMLKQRRMDQFIAKSDDVVEMNIKVAREIAYEENPQKKLDDERVIHLCNIEGMDLIQAMKRVENEKRKVFNDDLLDSLSSAHQISQAAEIEAAANKKVIENDSSPMDFSILDEPLLTESNPIHLDFEPAKTEIVEPIESIESIKPIKIEKPIEVKKEKQEKQEKVVESEHPEAYRFMSARQLRKRYADSPSSEEVEQIRQQLAKDKANGTAN
jgi:hypothetical protein